MRKAAAAPRRQRRQRRQRALGAVAEWRACSQVTPRRRAAPVRVSVAASVGWSPASFPATFVVRGKVNPLAAACIQKPIHHRMVRCASSALRAMCCNSRMHSMCWCAFVEKRLAPTSLCLPLRHLAKCIFRFFPRVLLGLPALS